MLADAEIVAMIFTVLNELGFKEFVTKVNNRKVLTAIGEYSGVPPTLLGGLYRALSFGRHALFADPFDREDLGITMAKIFRHPRLRTRLARMGAHKARSLFTWTGIAHQVVAAVEHRLGAGAVLDDTDWDEPWNDGD